MFTCSQYTIFNVITLSPHSCMDKSEGNILYSEIIPLSNRIQFMIGIEEQHMNHPIISYHKIYSRIS